MMVNIPSKGFLQGKTLIDAATKLPKCYRFSRVPYALPPVGSRRWRKPKPLPSNFLYGSEAHPGHFFGPSTPCPQLGTDPSIASEDCLQVNIYVPVGTPPGGGWPVFFYIHGGYLQYGTNNSEDPSDLIHETDMKCIVVTPGYRLGIFGFLASKEVSGIDSSEANFGLWDQRLALEWTYDNMDAFGGNKENITVGGLSAGAYSTFAQLAHDIGPNSSDQVIRRVFQWSNGCGVEPKRVFEMQEQFEDLLSCLQIPATWGPARKLAALRRTSAETLVQAVAKMKQKFFRPVLDGHFLSTDFYRQIYDGSFGQRMKALGIKIIIGDLTQEYHMYKWSYPPTSYTSLVDRLSWDYPRDVAVAVAAPYKNTPSVPSTSQEVWIDIFGKLYADMQIHVTSRGFIRSIAGAIPLTSINRYRIDWRTECIDRKIPREIGATHGTDLTIWFFGNAEGLTPSEKQTIKNWLQPVAAFIRGDDFDWGTKSLTEVKYITSSGKTDIREDDLWQATLPLWKVVEEVTVARPLNKPML